MMNIILTVMTDAFFYWYDMLMETYSLLIYVHMLTHNAWLQRDRYSTATGK